MLRGDIQDPASIEALLRSDAELNFKDTELKGLKARSGEEIVAKFEKLLRGHGLQDADLVIEELLNLADAGEAVQGERDGLLADVELGQDVSDGVELEDELLEPELVGLVNGDEEHFVVAGIALGKGDGLLAVKEFGEFEVVWVVELAAAGFAETDAGALLRVGGEWAGGLGVWRRMDWWGFRLDRGLWVHDAVQLDGGADYGD